MFASSTDPLPKHVQDAYFLRIYSALEDLANSELPSAISWDLMNDVFNLTETLIIDGFCRDDGKNLESAEKSLIESGNRYLSGQGMSVSPEELEPLRAMVADFQSIVATIPHKALIQLHRKTTQRILADRKTD